MWFLLQACLPPWNVELQRGPSPLQGVERLDLAPLRFPHLRVGQETEAEYLARMDEEERLQWASDLRELDRVWRATATEGAARCGIRLEPPGGPGTHTVAGEVTYIEPGFYAGAVSIASHVRLVVRITRQGRAVEEISMGGGTDPASIGFGPLLIPTAPAVVDRLRSDGAQLGEWTAEYLCARKAGK